MKRSDPAATNDPGASALQEGTPLRIGIIDDERGRITPFVKEGLASLRYANEIREYDDNERAIRDAGRFRPHLIYEDLGGTTPFFTSDMRDPIPGLVGIGLLQDTCPKTSLIVVSRVVDPRIVAAALQTGENVLGYFGLDDVFASSPQEFIVAAVEALKGRQVLSEHVKSAFGTWLRFGELKSPEYPLVVPILPHGAMSSEDEARFFEYARVRDTDNLAALLSRTADELGHFWRSRRAKNEMKFKVMATGGSGVEAFAVLADARLPLTSRSSPREAEAMDLLGQGLSQKQIATKMRVHPKTIGTNMKRAGRRISTGALPPTVSRGQKSHFIAEILAGRRGAPVIEM